MTIPGRWTTPLALAAFFLYSSGGASAQTIKVGVQLPITGERSSVGRLMLNGLQMALAKVNAAAGTQAPKLELVLADDESTTEGGVAALDRLVHDPQVLAIAGEINSPYVVASAPVIDKEGIPYVTGGSSPATTAQSPWIFRVGASDALLAELLARYIVEDLKFKQIAVLHDKTGIHNQRADRFATVLKAKYSLAPLFDASWSPGDRQFTAQMDQVKASQAQVVLALGETAEGGSFFRQVRTSGVTAQVIAHRDFGVKRVMDEAAETADGALIVTEFAPALQSEATQAWNAAYRKEYGSDANVIAAQYYDTLILLAEAMKTGGRTRAGVKSGLEHLKAFPGVLADYTFDAARNGIHRFYLAKIRGGNLTLVKILDEAPGH